MATNSSSSSSPSTSTPPPPKIDEAKLEKELFHVYNEEVRSCDENGQSTQHIGDEWMRREIRKICGFDVSDRWIKLFRRKYNIRYFSGRRHADKANKLTPLAALDTTKVKTSNFLKERRVLRTSRKEYVDVDLRVNEEIARRQAKGERLTNPWIREYAQFIASQLHPHLPYVEVEKFFDANWLYRFKRRYSVELKPRRADDSPKTLSVTPPMMNESDESSSMSKIKTEGPETETEREKEHGADYCSQMLQFQNHYLHFMNKGSPAN